MYYFANIMLFHEKSEYHLQKLSITDVYGAFSWRLKIVKTVKFKLKMFIIAFIQGK